jgi:hypothetical protein
VGPASPAKLVFQIDTGPALTGLKGRIALLPPALRVTDVRPIGAASGMQLAWVPLHDGATFTMFSTDGARIPPTRPCMSSVPCGPQPVLEVTASIDPAMPPPPLTMARMVELMASDTLGRTVGMCPTFAPVDMVARICAGDRVCDANGDGRSDVRDLALMVRCLRGATPCPDTLIARFDCNRDSVFTAADLLCCARRILRGPLPDSLPPRPIKELRIELGAPVATATGFDQTVGVFGADQLSAARLALTFTADAGLSGVELPGDPAGWLHVEEAGTGEALLGLIALTAPTTTELQALLHFTRAPAAGANAALTIADADFVDPEGLIVAPASGVVGVPGVASPQLVLSAARPNPFSLETIFDVSLATASDVRLGIYDLSGRLVVELFRGHMDAGARTFTWNGTRADGSRAADGVYFCRASAAGALGTRRLVLMRGK